MRYLRLDNSKFQCISDAVKIIFDEFIVYLDFDFNDDEEIYNLLDTKSAPFKSPDDLRSKIKIQSSVAMKGGRVLNSITTNSESATDFLASCLSFLETFVFVKNSELSIGLLEEKIDLSISKQGYFSSYQMRLSEA